MGGFGGVFSFFFGTIFRGRVRYKRCKVNEFSHETVLCFAAAVAAVRLWRK